MEDIPPEHKHATSGNLRRNFSLVSFRNALVKNAVEPIVSLKRVRITRESSGKLLLFILKVAALEVVRRGSVARCPQVWQGIQGLSLFQVPPLSWLQRWGPLRYFFLGSQMFSKPVLFLSLATTITGKLDEMRTVEEHGTVEEQTESTAEFTIGDSGAVGPLALWPATIGREHVDTQRSWVGAKDLPLLKENLMKAGFTVPERITDDELERFLVAANGNVKRCAALVKKTIRWRETFYFFSPYELENWSPLVFWHGYDVQMRPSLVIRIGWAYSILKAHERPRFAQAVLSQVEYGVTNLLHEEDPRITVILDCEGTPALGFPVHMLKSCSVLVQENYPTRLAALFVVNLPPVVRVIAQAIIRVLKPTTKRKIHVEGDQFASALAEHYGGAASMPNFLGGTCNCFNCQKAASTDRRTCLQYFNREQLHDETDSEVSSDENFRERDSNVYNRYNSVLRAIIVGFLMLWVIVGLLAGFLDPEVDFIAT